MLIIQKEPLESGAHINDRRKFFDTIPDGFVIVPPELEEKAWWMLPYIVLIFDEEGNLTDVARGETPSEKMLAVLTGEVE